MEMDSKFEICKNWEPKKPFWGYCHGVKKQAFICGNIQCKSCVEPAKLKILKGVK